MQHIPLEVVRHIEDLEEQVQQLTSGGSKEISIHKAEEGGMERREVLRAGTRRHANNPMEPRSAVIACKKWKLRETKY